MIPIKKRNLLIFFIALGFLSVICQKAEALGITTSSIQFTGITLSGYDQFASGTTNAWVVDASDESGGWNITISATDFINQNLQVISSQNLEIRLLAEKIVVVSGSSGPVSALTTYTPIGSNNVRIITSEIGQGTGIYEITPDFRLNVPAQAYAGNYASTITLTVVSGP